MVALAGEYSHSMRRSNLGWVKGSCSAAFLIVILISVPGVVNCDSENISDSSSILENLLKSFQSENNSIKCEKDVKTVLRGLNEDQLWALRIADASGKVTPNFVFGSNFWFGSKTACDSVNQRTTLGISQEITAVHDILKSVSPVPVAYQVFVVNFTSPKQIDVQFNVRPFIHIGLCLPLSCDLTDFYHPLEENIVNSLQSLDVRNVKVLYHKEGLNYRWNVLKIEEFYILLATIALSIAISLLYKILFQKKCVSKEEEPAKDCERNQGKKRRGIGETLLKCFSIKDNWHQVFQNKTPPKEISGINGIRTIACLWIIILHTNIYARFAVSSIPEVQHLMTNSGILMRILSYGFVSVDSFFAISGFLLVFNFLRNDLLRKKIKERIFFKTLPTYLRYVGHRYLRLTPLLIVVMVGIRLLNAYLDKSSVFDVRSNVPDLQCNSDMILLNLIYSQNLVNGFLICGSWLWYLANDMQYYIIFLALLFVYAKHPLFAKIIFALSAICTLAITFSVCYLNGFTLHADVIYRLYEKTYTVPYIRVIPFQAGMIVGYMANWHRKDPIKAKPIFIILAWILLIGYLLAPIIASSDVDSISPLICAIMYSIGKFVYGLAIGGVILLCLIASQSTIPKILSHKLFVHLNKLCYGMFLVHPIVVLLLFGLRTQAATLSASLVVTYSLAVIVISYLLALLMCVLIELPFIRLSNLILKK